MYIYKEKYWNISRNEEQKIGKPLEKKENNIQTPIFQISASVRRSWEKTSERVPGFQICSGP